MTLEEFEAICEKATPGPWHNVYHNRTKSNALTFFTEGCDLLNDMANVIAQAPDGSVARHDDNFEFIGACREMVPRMIKAMKALKQVRDHPLIRSCVMDAKNDPHPFPGSLWIDWARAFDALEELEKP